MSATSLIGVDSRSGDFRSKEARRATCGTCVCLSRTQNAPGAVAAHSGSFVATNAHLKSTFWQQESYSTSDILLAYDTASTSPSVPFLLPGSDVNISRILTGIIS